jgi:hypothetical protein
MAPTLQDAFKVMQNLSLDVRQYFKYYGEDDEWYEALTFCVTAEDPDDDALIINFYKESSDATHFKLQYGYERNGEWFFRQRDGFQENKDSYESWVFPIYIICFVMRLGWVIARDDQKSLSDSHFMFIARALSDLAFFLETTMMTRGMLPSLEGTNAYELIESLYDDMGIEKTLNW